MQWKLSLLIVSLIQHTLCFLLSYKFKFFLYLSIMLILRLLMFLQIYIFIIWFIACSCIIFIIVVFCCVENDAHLYKEPAEKRLQGKQRTHWKNNIYLLHVGFLTQSRMVRRQRMNEGSDFILPVSNESCRTVAGELPVSAVPSVEAGIIPDLITTHRNGQLGNAKRKTRGETCVSRASAHFKLP